MNHASSETKLWEIIELDFAASLMNTTKWTEALDALVDLNVHYQIKLITETDPSPWLRHLQHGGNASYLPHGWIEGYYSPAPVLEIEWMNIQPVLMEALELIKEVESRFKALSIPFENRTNMIRVVGHVRR